MRAALLAALAVCAAEGTAPSSVTVHYMSNRGWVDHIYSSSQEWDISCTPYSLIGFNDYTSGSGYSLTASYEPLRSYESLHGDGQNVMCDSTGSVKLRYAPFNGTHLVSVSWYPVTTYAPATYETSTRTPYWITPVPSPATMHYVSDTGSVDSYYSTPQEWSISCTPHSTVVLRVMQVTSYATFTMGGRSTSSSANNYDTCPSSGNSRGTMSLLYTPTNGNSHRLMFKWYSSTNSPSYWYTPAPTPSPAATVHYMTYSGSIFNYYSTPQEWLISCTPYSTLYVTVTKYSGVLLKADTMYLSEGLWDVSCPYTGQVKLSYVPYSGPSEVLILKWSPDAGDSHSISPLLIALVATAGLLVLVGVTVAVYCGCRGKAADPNAYSSNVQVEGYADVVHTGGFGGLQDSSTAGYVGYPSVGQQPMSAMNEQLLPAAEIDPL